VLFNKFLHIYETVNTVKICTTNKDYSHRLYTNDSISHKTLKLATNPQHHARQTDWLSPDKLTGCQSQSELDFMLQRIMGTSQEEIYQSYP